MRVLYKSLLNPSTRHFDSKWSVHKTREEDHGLAHSVHLQLDLRKGHEDKLNLP